VQSQRPRKLARASVGKSSLSISAQPLELVVISDSKLEPEDNDDHSTKTVSGPLPPAQETSLSVVIAHHNSC
jgi:hypothetical protein